MNEKSKSFEHVRLTFDEDVIRILYRKYKEFLIPSGVILGSILILFFLIFPQIGVVLQYNEEADKIKATLKTLKSNKDYLTALDQAKLDYQNDLVSKALPREKDYKDILYALAGASQRSGVSLGDFGFQVGNLSTESASLTVQKPAIEINISILGDINGTKRFATELMQRLPLSEISTMQMSQKGSQLLTRFFFKPYLVTTYNPSSPIEPLSQKQLDIINKISQWNNSNSQ